MKTSSKHFRRTVHVLSLAAGLLAAAPSFAQATLPSNWSASPQDDGGTIYRAVGLPKTSLLNVWALPPLPAAGMKTEEAFAQFKRKYGTIGFKPLAEPRCKDATLDRGSVRQECVMEIQGASVQTFFVLMPLRNGMADFYRVVSAGDPELQRPYSGGVAAALSIETRKRAAGGSGGGSGGGGGGTAGGEGAPAAEPQQVPERVEREPIPQIIRP
jgi:hypothetical protein